MAVRWKPRHGGSVHGRVVLLHDVTSSGRSWWRVGPALATRGYDVLALDLAAHGSKPPLDRPLDLTTLVRGVIDELPGRADLLVGHGIGGVVALVLASRYADIARTVAVEDPWPGSTRSRDALISAILLESAYARVDPETLAARLRGANPGWSDIDVDGAVRDLGTADTPSIVAGLRSRMTWDLGTLAGGLRVPLLVLTPPADPFGELPALQGVDRKELRNLVPPAHFVELAGGHALHRDAPEPWIRAVLAFAAHLDSAA